MNHTWLVVSTLWKIWKSVGVTIPNISGKIKFMFQTTNQIYFVLKSASALQLYWIMWFMIWFMNVYDNYVDHYSLWLSSICGSWCVWRFFWIIVMIVLCNCHLVGGFNHLEKYESQWEGLSHILWKKNVPKHQPVPNIYRFIGFSIN